MAEEYECIDTFDTKPSNPYLDWTMERVRAAMTTCLQTPTQTVLEHGVSVWDHFRLLHDHFTSGTSLPSWWRVPQWAYTPGLIDLLMPLDVVEEYILNHDCSKPIVLQVYEDGRRHFPGHAKASEQVWLAVGGNPVAARLMGMDMDAHLLKAEGIAEFASRPEATTLLLTALAEVHSNAAMFGGVESDGFKIKAKHLDKRGRQVVAAMNWEDAREAA